MKDWMKVMWLAEGALVIYILTMSAKAEERPWHRKR